MKIKIAIILQILNNNTIVIKNTWNTLCKKCIKWDYMGYESKKQQNKQKTCPRLQFSKRIGQYD